MCRKLDDRISYGRACIAGRLSSRRRMADAHGWRTVARPESGSHAMFIEETLAC